MTVRTSYDLTVDDAAVRREFAAALTQFREMHPLAVVQVMPRPGGRAGIWILAPDLPPLLPDRDAEFWRLFGGNESLGERADDVLLLTPGEARERAAHLAEVETDGEPAPCWNNGDVVRTTVAGHHLYAARHWGAESPDGPCYAAFGIDCPPGWYIPGIGGAPVRSGGEYFAFDLTEPLLNDAGEVRSFPTAEAARAAAFAEAECRLAAHAALQSAPADAERATDAAAPALAAA